MNRRVRVVIGCWLAAVVAGAAMIPALRSAPRLDASELGPALPESDGSSIPGPDRSGSSLPPTPVTVVSPPALSQESKGTQPRGPSAAPSSPAVPPSRPAVTARPALPAAPGLVTNEFAYHHPGSPDAVRSPDWIVSSGSLFGTGNLLWSGRPDDRAPGPTSAKATDSAVLRAVSTRDDHQDVRVSFGVRIEQLTRTRRTPAADTDGVHVILRYQSELSTYYVSVFRRDGKVAIKKKVPGGPSNGGTYVTLATRESSADTRTSWHQVDATISRDGPAVRLTLRLDGAEALDAVDSGTTAPVIASPGRVGLRGDNCEFYVRDFRVVPRAEP